MEYDQEQKIIKYLNKINTEIQVIEQNLGYIDGVPHHVRDARFELLHIIQLFKLDNEDNEDNEKKRKRKERD